MFQRFRSRKQLDRDLQDELAAHLALKQQRLEQQGMRPEDAQREARLALGNPAVWKESAREQWTWTGLESFWRDLTFAVRLLARDRMFTLVALLTLMLGIGANAAVFALMNGLLWRSLPVRDPQELVRIRVTNLPPNERAWLNGRATAPKERRQISFPLYQALNRSQQIFESTSGMSGNGSFVVDIGGTPHQLSMTTVTGSYFRMLGVEPEAGRMFSDADDVPGGPASGWGIVISDAVWERLFSRRPAAIGTQVTVERVPFTILGVAPARFSGVQPGMQIDVWLPLSAFEVMYPKWHWRHDPGMWMLQTMARLKPGVTLEQARQQLSAMSEPLLRQAKEQGLRAEDEKYFLAMKLDAVSARSGFSWMVESFGPVLWLLMAVVTAVLLIAATNLTNLLLARSTARRQEISIRLALGASASRVRRQLLVESTVLALTGAAMGIVFAQWLTWALLGGVSDPESPVRLDTSTDWKVLAFLAAVLIVVVVIAGWAPAWSVLRNAGNQQRTSSKPVTALRGGLIVLQMAFSVALLGGAGLLLSSLQSLLNVDTGFHSQQTVFVSADLFNAGVSRERMPQVYENLLNEVRQQPGVQAAAWTMHMPLTGGLQAYTIEVPGHNDMPANDRMVFAHHVTDGYFAAAGIALRAGRDFSPQGVNGPRSTIISENVAKKFFGSAQAAIGQRLKPNNTEWTEIIGVAADAKFQHVREPNPPTVYTSYWEEPTTLGMNLVIQYKGRREPIVTAVQGLLRREAGRLPFIKVRTLDENVEASVASERMLAQVLSGFALFALLISGTGIAGLLSYSVQLRRHEIGIRIALGAAPVQIERQFERYGAMLAAIGLCLGLGISLWLKKALDAWLFGVQSTDPRIWIAVSVVLVLCAIAAAAIPARRAARLDPMQVLRAE